MHEMNSKCGASVRLYSDVFGEKQFKTYLGNEDYVHDAKMFRRFSAQQHGY